MKKLILVLLGIIFCSTCVYCAQVTKFSKKFIKNFKDCDSYTESVTSEFEGETYTTTRKIIGWKNGMCRYQSTIESKNDKYQLDCNFAELQLDEIYEAMKSRSTEQERYNLELFAPSKNSKKGEPEYIKTGSTIIKGNRAYIVWAKYENNPYFCKPTKLR